MFSTARAIFDVCGEYPSCWNNMSGRKINGKFSNKIGNFVFNKTEYLLLSRLFSKKIEPTI